MTRRAAAKAAGGARKTSPRGDHEDIPGSKRANAPLDQDRGRSRSIIEAAMDGFWLATTQGRLLEVNEAYCRMSGYSRAELLGMQIPDLDVAVGLDPATSPIVRTVIEQGEHRFETRHRRKDGTLFDVEVSVQYRPDEGQLIVFLRDITERNRAAEALRVSEARYRSMLDTSPDTVGLTDLEGRIRMASPAALRLLGCDREEDLIGRLVTDLLVPEDRARALSRITEILNGIPPSPTEYTGLRFDGSTVPIEVNSQFLRRAGGRPTEMILLIRDITDRKHAEQALRLSESRYRSILNASPDNITITDLKAVIVMVSPAGLAMMGYERSADLAGRPLAEFIATEDRERAGANIALMFQGTFTGPTEYKGRRADGSSIEVEVNGEFIRDASGEPTQIVFIARNITDRKEADDALRLSLKEKEGLLREVHHRVKNNLQVIASLLRLETSRSDVADTKRVLKDMQGRILSMAVLHETLYRSGRFGQVELGGYLRQLAQQLFRATSGSARLSLEMSPVLVETDQAIPCGLIVNELLTNSLKHAFAEGSGGEVTMSLAMDAQGEARFSVRDTGVGLPHDFEAKRGRSLGLQLVTDLVRQIGGHLAIDQGPGAGFVVTFTPVLNSATVPNA